MFDFTEASIFFTRYNLISCHLSIHKSLLTEKNERERENERGRQRKKSVKNCPFSGSLHKSQLSMGDAIVPETVFTKAHNRQLGDEKHKALFNLFRRVLEARSPLRPEWFARFMRGEIICKIKWAVDNRMRMQCKGRTES